MNQKQRPTLNAFRCKVIVGFLILSLATLWNGYKLHPLSAISFELPHAAHQTHNNKYLDLGVPLAHQDHRLLSFCRDLGPTISQFQRTSNVRVRLLISRFPDEAFYQSDSTEFRTKLAHLARLPIDHIVLVDVPPHRATTKLFSRALALNVLHQATKKSSDSVLALLDVDMQVGPQFLQHALYWVAPTIFYFPIVFSQFRPSTVELVKVVLPTAYDQFSIHAGLWRSFGFGMYALSGTDAHLVQLSESFQGWGGEDNDLHQQVLERNYTVIRQEEYGLVHKWHPKYCTAGKYVSKDRKFPW